MIYKITNVLDQPEEVHQLLTIPWLNKVPNRLHMFSGRFNSIFFGAVSEYLCSLYAELALGEFLTGAGV